jgi:hypothetical protein
VRPWWLIGWSFDDEKLMGGGLESSGVLLEHRSAGVLRIEAGDP